MDLNRVTTTSSEKDFLLTIEPLLQNQTKVNIDMTSTSTSVELPDVQQLQKEEVRTGDSVLPSASVREERVFLPAGHGLQFGFTLGQLDKAEKLKLAVFSNISPFTDGQ